MKYCTLPVLLCLLLPCNLDAQKLNNRVTYVTKAEIAPIIDGYKKDACWKSATWYPLNQKWLGKDYTQKDFKGRYKLSWSKDVMHLLVEIKDDILVDQYEDPKKLWWDDDCLEVFVDEDNSGGNHQFNHNAFAYHIALNNHVIDLGPDEQPHFYDDHITCKRRTKGKKSTWELSFKLYSDEYIDDFINQAVELQANKKVGFALAYCDNDGSKERENFIGSEVVEGEDKNRGWIDAGIFGTLILVDSK